ncbi:MAG: TonB family protein [Deltaproteobacteria bacterium]|nr:TonB family protein [Deltaproteobacteria bacterium]
MPENRTIAICIALSFLAHLTALFLASFVPWTARKGESVMVVDIADLPRAQDFLPPKAGIMEGAPPKPAEKRAPPPPRARGREPVPPRMMKGRVPDLPVNPALPAEESFANVRPKDTPAGQPGKEASQQPARSAGKSAQGGTGSAGKPLRDLNPSLGATVLAMAKKDGPGSGSGPGNAVGTRGKAGDKGGIVEEGGGGARLTALNAPEIQYISYFAGIKRKIELVWGYPAGANGIEGDVIIDFVIARNGKLMSATMIRSSGNRALDEEAIGAIRKGAPYSPIPSDYNISNLQIRAHFEYTVTHTRILR